MARSGPITYFSEPTLLRLAGTDMVEVGTHYIFQEASITVAGWQVMGKYGPTAYFTEPELLWLAGMVMVMVGAHNILHVPALLWLAGMVMSEIRVP